MKPLALLRAAVMGGSLVLGSGSLATLVGCGRPATPAELQDWGTRTYSGTSKAAAFKACVTAVRTQGYDVVTADAGLGQVRTAPKTVSVTAVATSSYTAAATSNQLAWDLDVTTSPAGTVVHATPRGYSAGQEVPATKMNSAYVKKALETLFSEIERDMGVT